MSVAGVASEKIEDKSATALDTAPKRSLRMPEIESKIRRSTLDSPTGSETTSAAGLVVAWLEPRGAVCDVRMAPTVPHEDDQQVTPRRRNVSVEMSISRQM